MLINNWFSSHCNCLKSYPVQSHVNLSSNVPWSFSHATSRLDETLILNIPETYIVFPIVTQQSIKHLIQYDISQQNLKFPKSKKLQTIRQRSRNTSRRPVPGYFPSLPPPRHCCQVVRGGAPEQEALPHFRVRNWFGRL